MRKRKPKVLLVGVCFFISAFIVNGLGASKLWATKGTPSASPLDAFQCILGLPSIIQNSFFTSVTDVTSFISSSNDGECGKPNDPKRVKFDRVIRSRLDHSFAKGDEAYCEIFSAYNQDRANFKKLLKLNENLNLNQLPDLIAKIQKLGDLKDSDIVQYIKSEDGFIFFNSEQEYFAKGGFKKVFAATLLKINPPNIENYAILMPSKDRYVSEIEKEAEIYKELGSLPGIGSANRISFKKKSRDVVALVQKRYKGDLLALGTLSGLDSGHDKPRKVLETLHEIAQGLVSIHEKGYVHSDLKPQNVLVDNDGHAKIVDLGLTFKAKEGLKLQGTYFYLPPEVFGHTKAGTKAEAVQKVDVYSFGIMVATAVGVKKNLFEICLEEAYSNYSCNKSKTIKILESLKKMVSKNCDKTKPCLEKIAIECLAIDPEVRPNSKTLEAELKALLL